MLPTPYLYCIVEILNWQFVVNFRLFFWFLFHPLETLPHLFADFTFYHDTSYWMLAVAHAIDSIHSRVVNLLSSKVEVTLH